VSMAKNLEPSDFRAVRRVLEPDDFALTGDKPDGPPIDLISEEAWDHIMTLPSDVAIRTSGFQGSRISLLNDATAGWTEILPTTDIIASAMLDVADNLYSSTFSQLHGFYKEAIATLRSALETSVLAVECVLETDEERWKRWEHGEEIRFGNTCDQLLALPSLQPREDLVLRKCSSGIFIGDDRTNRSAWARALYRKLCRYSHARGDATNAAMWSSNGPIYGADGFKASYHTFLEVHAICLILVKLAEPAVPLTSIAELVLRPDSLEHYLDEPYRSICTTYCSALW
ncbi:MAG: hypothetical protein ACREBW_08275, partial [Candidatus Micrarchaeaceae archaeon]